MQERTHASLVALRRILKATDQHARALSRSTGLTAAQRVLMQIIAEAGETTPKEIASRARISQATVTSLIDKLEHRGFARRIRGETDRRQIWISLTPEGRQTMETAPDALQELFSTRFEALENWEQAMIVSSLERVATMLNAHAIDASPLLDGSAIDR